METRLSSNPNGEIATIYLGPHDLVGVLAAKRAGLATAGTALTGVVLDGDKATILEPAEAAQRREAWVRQYGDLARADPMMKRLLEIWGTKPPPKPLSRGP